MLCIQDPTYSNSMLLHEALLNAAENALYGAGVYAFASADGAMLLLEDATFSEFLHRGRFSLIVGIDEITTPKALAIIEKKSLDSNHHLSAAAFVHSSSNSTLFHPKFSWFKYENGGSLIIGSGNLTQGGLRRNYEAFAWMQLSETEIISIETEWNLWQKENTANFFDLENPIVQEITKNNAYCNSQKLNSIKHLSVGQPRKIPFSQTMDQPQDNDSNDASYTVQAEEDYPAWAFAYDSPVLIEQLTRDTTGKRAKQINFRKAPFSHFFGAQPGVNKKYRAAFKGVMPDGTVLDVEIRAAVSSASKNYRFDLNAVQNRPQQDSQLIGVFIKVSERNYLYSILYPEDRGYEKLLDEVVKNREVNDQYSAYYYADGKLLKTFCPELAILDFLL